MIVTDRDTEQHRHECEARFVSAMPSDAARREYLAGVARRRGPEAAQRLRAALAECLHHAEGMRVWDERDWRYFAPQARRIHDVAAAALRDPGVDR